MLVLSTVWTTEGSSPVDIHRALHTTTRLVLVEAARDLAEEAIAMDVVAGQDVPEEEVLPATAPPGSYVGICPASRATPKDEHSPCRSCPNRVRNAR